MVAYRVVGCWLPVHNVASAGSLKQAFTVNRSIVWLEQIDPSHLAASTLGRVVAALYVAVRSIRKLKRFQMRKHLFK